MGSVSSSRGVLRATLYQQRDIVSDEFEAAAAFVGEVHDWDQHVPLSSYMAVRTSVDNPLLL